MKIKLFLKSGFQIICYLSLSIFLISCNTLNPEKKELNNVIANAEKAASADNYDSAVKSYIDAIIKAETADPERVYSLKKTLSRTYIEWARSLYWKAKTDKDPDLLEKAIYLCEKALQVNPKYKVKCGIYISKFKKELRDLKYKKETSLENLMPGAKEREYKVAVLAKQGQVLRLDGKYMMAVEKYQEVLKLDPFNLEAARQIKKIMKTVAEIGKTKAETDRATRMAEAEWKGVEPVAEREEAMEIARREAEAGNELKSRLVSCLIKEIDFKDIPLDQAFTILEKQIKEALKQKFEFQFKGFSPSDKKFAPVTFNGKDIPADGAIEALCGGFNMFPTYSSGVVTIEERPK